MLRSTLFVIAPAVAMLLRCLPEPYPPTETHHPSGPDRFGWIERVHPDDRARTVAAWHEALETGAAYTADFRLEPFDSNLYTGRMVWTTPKSFSILPEGSGITLQYERYAATNGFASAMFSSGIRIPLRKK